MLFTSDVDKSFRDTGCGDASFDYTPLNAIDVHWTYKKGDKTIDMGYINIELLRKNLLDLLKLMKPDFFTVKEFAHFYLLAIEEEGDKEVGQAH